MKGPTPGVPAYIEPLRQLQRWIKACGTEEADKYEPPSERAADAAIDAVLKDLEHLRTENVSLKGRCCFAGVAKACPIHEGGSRT